MDCSWADMQLLSDQRLGQDLPPELMLALRQGDGSHYLAALAVTALQPGFLRRIFTLYEPLIPELAARWISSQDPRFNSLQILSTLARILPLAPYLKSLTDEFLSTQQDKMFSLLSQSRQLTLIDLNDDLLHQLLLAFFRLVSYDSRTFGRHVSPIQLQSLLVHSKRSTRYLAIRILCMYMHASDAAMEGMLEKYLGDATIEGEWEDITIDYIFLSLWEEKRLKNLSDDLRGCRAARESSNVPEACHFLRQHLSLRTAQIAGVLLPRASQSLTNPPKIVYTNTTNANLHNLAKALLRPKPILVTGSASSGKTTLINHVARELSSSSKMIVLHLNEQTDAKSLLGTYTSTKPGSFSWQSGVLSRAVEEGRWLLLEDIDRAPPEVMSIIMPILEKGELLIPSRKERFRAPPGFRIIATMRSIFNQGREEILPARKMLGLRLFHTIQIGRMESPEIRDVMVSLFPLLEAHTASIMSIFEQLLTIVNTNYMAKSAYGRSIGLRDLLKFARRFDACLRSSGFRTDHEAMSEPTIDDVFLHAVDCFAGGVSNEWLRSKITDCIARIMQIAPQKVQYCLHERAPSILDLGTSVQVGRAKVSKVIQPEKRGSWSGSQQSRFANTRHAMRTLEQISAATQTAEPVLLVGETGIGKTAMVQQLAQITSQTLTVINLSQQSESGDLLGGFKPVNIRSLAVPMVEEFDILFEQTFSSRKNIKFLTSLSKNVRKGNWDRVVSFWQEGVRMSESLSLANGNDHWDESTSQPAKKRKLDAPKHADLKHRWSRFASSLKNLEMHLTNGGSKVAFSFVEGKIVRAVRNGEWVLLDEINLASPATLESIADLFNTGSEGSPSLLLSDSGEIERIQANESFRVFAAMNPATDAGKRDLFAGIRSRFTEFYVDSPDKELKDLLHLIKTYLGNLIDSDERVILDVAKLHMEIKQITTENKLTDGAGEKPHFSLRTLVRVLVYVIDHAPVYGLRRGLYEGFSMSYLTILSKASEQLIVPLVDRYILDAHRNVRSLLGQTPQAPKDGKEHVQFKHYWMTKGHLIPQEQPHYIITPFIERNLLNLVRASSTKRFPILLQGPTSSGKTSMVEYLARISGNEFVRINNHEHTDLQEYLGSYASGEDGRLSFREGILVEALRKGYWMVLDELNLAPTDVLEALNRLLDDNRELLIPETQEIVRPHPNFMLFATQNPPGLYGGRKVLSRAFRNRFLELHFDDIPEDELEYILQERSRIAPSFCTKIVAVYKKLSILRQSNRLFEQKNSFATLRDLFRWALRRADNREELAVNGFMLLAERVRNEQEKAAVKKIIEEVIKVNIDENKIYANEPLRLNPDNENLWNVVWTPAMKRLSVLVARALEHNEPVLLVGETGCGKTQICQTISMVLGKRLEILNAHMNSEAGDLIGAQRPVRNRTATQQQLAADLRTVLSGLGHPVASDISSDDLVSMFAELDEPQINQCPSSLLHAVRRNISKLTSLFEWADGPLVNAMKSGHHFLLDEISLADDSVLERLNSVLEPARTLLLAEKGPTESLVIAADGFQFLATMNPGGDYGKRELSAALRNRLTEIWVPSLTKDEDIVPILERKLHSVSGTFAKDMVKFCRWFNESFHNSPTSSVSVRDLLAWVDFLNTQPHSEACGAIVQGAAMVFIDTLGANPASMVATTVENITLERSRCLDELGHLFNCNPSAMYHKSVYMHLDKQSLSIGDFKMPRSSTADVDPDFILRAPTTLLNAMRLLRAMQLSKPILLEGSPGVGKTTTIVALARVAGRPLTRINLSEQTDLIDLFGSDIPVEGAAAGHFAWRDASFLTAMQKGEWVLLDEMNLASQSVLEGLNSCLDHRGEVYIAELDQKFNRHPDFMLFAAQNPHHQGGGRKGLPASFVNRFTVVYADAFQAADLQFICTKLFPQIPEQKTADIIKFVSSLSAELILANRFGSDGAPWELNLRDVIRWLKLLSIVPGQLHPEEFLDVIVRQRFRAEGDRNHVTQLFNQAFGTLSLEKSFFHNLTPSFYQVGLGMLHRNMISQPVEVSNTEVHPKYLPIIESVLLCIQSNWPCILVGPSGCGKTRVLNHVATMSGRQLVEIAMNPEIDTLDLVGGFEQVDIRRQISSFIDSLRGYIQHQVIGTIAGNDHNEGIHLLLQLMHQVFLVTPSLAELLPLLVQLGDLGPDPSIREFAETCQVLLNSQHVIEKGEFEWTDGILISALQKGHWVVLDNANLCTSSVLDRLNSLLEPSGNLIVNEKLAPDGQAHIAKPHPNFRIFLTMDPRHGELSRAMRNRAVEIYFPHGEYLAETDHTLSYGSESAIHRFRAFQNMDWASVPSSSMSGVFQEFINHYSIRDWRRASRWVKSIKAGLSYLDERQRGCFDVAMKPYFYFSPFRLDQEKMDEKFMVQIVRQYQILEQTLGLATSLGTSQPVHPLVNEPFVPTMAENNLSNRPGDLASFYELWIALRGLMLALTSDAKKAHFSKLRALMGGPSGHHRRKDAPSEMIDEFLCSFYDSIYNVVEGISQFNGAKAKWSNPIQNVISYCEDLLSLTYREGFEIDYLQIYLTLGRRLYQDLKSLGADFDQLAETLRAGLYPLDSQWKGTAGLSLGRMWNSWRPNTPSSHEQFKSMLQLEGIAERFDSLVWKVRMPITELGRIRERLAEARIAVLLSHNDVDLSLSSLSIAVNDIECTIPTEEEQSLVPYFSEEFEVLALYQDLSRTETRERQSEHVFNRTTLDLLAMRSSTCEPVLTQRSRYFSSLNALKPSPTVSAITGYLPISTLDRINSMDGVALANMNMLTMELPELGTSFSVSTPEIGADQVMLFYCPLYHLLHKIVDSHLDFLDMDRFTQLSHRLQNPGGSGSTYQIRSISGCLVSSIVNDYHHFYHVANDFLDPCVFHMLSSSRDSPNRLRHIGLAWLYVSLAWIKLFVPDRFVDPALSIQVEQDLYHSRKEEQQIKLQSLQIFEQNFTGRESNLRSRLVKEEIELMGPEPDVPPVYRPTRSKAHELQPLFNTILAFTDRKFAVTNGGRSETTARKEGAPQSTLLQRLAQVDASSLQEVSLIQEGLAQIQDRLRNSHREYDDLTLPIIWMTRCLNVGLEMIQIATEKPDASPFAKAVQYITHRTPLMDGNWQSLLQLPEALPRINGRASFDPLLHYLSGLRLVSVVGLRPLDSISDRRNLATVFDQLYWNWKTQLSKDQEEAAANSRTFHYRERENDRAWEKVEMDAMFPTYSEALPSNESPLNPSRNTPREMAIKLAKLLASITRPNEDVQSALKNNVLEATRSISTLQSKNKEAIPGPGNLITGVLLAMDQATQELQPSSSAANSCNFYTDRNIFEAKKLLELIDMIKARFREIQAVWPEHATLKDVLACCSELLGFKHTEPVAKFLTKAEKLHGFVNEWQSVASREFSVVKVYDQLTSLLISWRRLELSTWASLLDNEDKKTQEDADSWFFNAWETVIAIPSQLDSSEKEFDDYIEGLVSTLGGFFSETSHGQYGARLRLVKDIHAYMNHFIIDNPLLLPIKESVANFLAYYGRFEESVTQNIRNARQKLEKDLKEQIQLASWKDTNVSALRESARRSHHKLFKIVRKYRTILAQPVNLSNTGPVAEKVSLPRVENPRIESLDLKPTSLDPFAVELCSNYPVLRDGRSEELKDPASTAAQLLVSYRSTLPAFDPSSCIEGFTTDLIDSIQQLRKVTPNNLTEANKAFVSHLNSRKRKLLADTAKCIRNMGIRGNLPTATLVRQSSLARTLASTPALTSECMPHLIDNSEECYFRFLDLVLQARQVTRHHSGDLTPSQVTHMLGVVEGLLSLIRQQRTDLGLGLNEFDVLDSRIKQIENLLPSGHTILCIDDGGSSLRDFNLRRCIKWLPHILALSKSVIQIHEKVSRVDSTVVFDAFQNYLTRFRKLSEEFEELPSLPRGVTLHMIHSVNEMAKSALIEFKHDLDQWIERFPYVAFALRHLRSWTVIDENATNGSMPDREIQFGVVDLKQKVEQTVQHVIDAMKNLEAIQQAPLNSFNQSKILVGEPETRGFPTSTEDPSWLAESDRAHGACIVALRMGVIATEIDSALSMLQHFEDKTQSDGDCRIVGALFSLALPILSRYKLICGDVLERRAKLHYETCRLAHVLTKNFIALCKEGFCSPQDPSVGEKEEFGKLETGTGLGEGGGAQDISKDVQVDEDLDELFQVPDEKEDGEDIEGEKDAVDGKLEDMEEETVDAFEKEDDDDDGGSEGDGEESDIDDEVGSVDDSDAGAVDEKFLGGEGKEEEKESKSKKGKGSAKKDELATAQENALDQEQNEFIESEGVDEDKGSSVDEEGDAVGREEPGITDPYALEEEALNLPDEMQLDGEKKSDDGMDEDQENVDAISEIDKDEVQDKVSEGDAELSSGVSANGVDEQMEEEAIAGEEEQDASHEPDGSQDGGEDPEGMLRMEEDKAAVDIDTSAMVDSIVTGTGPDQDHNKEQQQQKGNANQDQSMEDMSDQHQRGVTSTEARDGQKMTNVDGTGGRVDDVQETAQMQAFRKLGDTLEQWHRQQWHIQEASGDNQPQQDTDMADVNFQHLQHEDEAADTQALGAATNEQARALDPTNALDASEDPPRTILPDADEVEEKEANDNGMELDVEPQSSSTKETSEAGAFIGSEVSRRSTLQQQPPSGPPQEPEAIEDVDEHLSSIHLNPSHTPLTSPSEAYQLWTHYSAITHTLSLTLTEQLRLILAPTLATRMRGDFRTGKRLNIKRIIPYIASGYRRDKIWMRRSVPSKRSYQVMLAVDDSKSMLESGSGLAFETLALVAKALSSLEVGDICVVGFGNEPHVRVAHDFGKPFTNDAGAQVFQQFSFQQTGTNVRQLVQDSLSLFRDAHAKTISTSPSQTDLWQLELIISDGICEDHDSIRRLVRQAQEERIMIIFIIVDNLAQASGGVRKGTSIMDLTQAVFESEGEGGVPGKVTVKRYLEGFPFNYYLVVRNVGELPGVLGGALKQWFGEVNGV